MLKSKALWGLVLGFLALHVALAVSIPLVEDEAYYQLWATVPSAGYYDHPPMVAWGIAAGHAVFGKTLLGARAAFVLVVALVTLLTFRIAWLFSRDEVTAFRAALYGAVMLPFAALGFAATPDAPSVLFWTAAVWALAEVLVGGTVWWWLLVGLFAGLGVLSKFTDLFFGLALVIWLASSKAGRGWLKVWQVWAGALIGLAVLVPFLRWNMAHDWIGFERQFGRIGDDAAFSLADFAGFWGSFVLLVTPLVFWLALRSVWSGRVPSVLIWLSAPIVLFLTYQATNSLAGGQWLVPVYPTLAVMAALGLRQDQTSGWLARLAAPVALTMAALVLVLGFWPGRVLVGGKPFTQVRGWDGVTTDIQAVMAREGASWIATDAYGLTGQMAHYFGDAVPVWSMTGPERYLFRGPLPAELCTAKGLFISRAQFPEGVPYFTQSAGLADVLRREGDRVLVRYGVAVVQGVRACAVTE